MTSDNHSRRLAANKRVLTRPANLHLAWSASKGFASTFSHSSSSSNPAHPSLQTSISTSPSVQSQHRPVQFSAISRPLPAHPYSSFVARSDDAWLTDPFKRPSSSSMEQHSSSTSKNGWSASSGADESTCILMSGHLTWKNATDNSSRKGAISGFEKALRRRQVARDTSDKDRLVYVTLEQVEVLSRDTRMHPGKPFTQHTFTSEPLLASPVACDPSAFDIDGIKSLIPPSVPISLSDQNRWVPPSSWDVFATSSSGHDSHSKSSTSTISDPLQTPRCSQPVITKEHETFLNVYSQNVAKGRSTPTSRGALQMRLLIGHRSTVEIQSILGEADTLEGFPRLHQRQLVITGESNNSSSKEMESSTSTSVCILTSPNMAELDEWLYSVKTAIETGNSSNREQFETRRSSETRLDTIRLLEQLRFQRDDAWCNDNVQHATPMAASLSLPSIGMPPTSSGIDSVGSAETGSDFSPSTFIDFYAAKPDSAATVADKEPEALYDFEDAYSRIMQRFSGLDLASPMHSPPSAPLNECMRHASAECLDVPVSPCSIEFDQDSWEDHDVEEPSSPLDPWISQRGTRSASSLSNHETYSDDTVKQIFAEGFRRRSSTLSCLPADK
ncbi:uncharacterized protein UTRI_00443 [Ustilago trichophora]|uniref:PH domain-containing protein n=1 Tax=Ustilago trichophora TaxID=86804 RepID=A0A5C3DUY0_9BASI|nr:uncharacterized protein UTRI_00443 [Ustilago trichophora]